jgi:hypothetical protein
VCVCVGGVNFHKHCLSMTALHLRDTHQPHQPSPRSHHALRIHTSPCHLTTTPTTNLKTDPLRTVKRTFSSSSEATTLHGDALASRKPMTGE